MLSDLEMLRIRNVAPAYRTEEFHFGSSVSQESTKYAYDSMRISKLVRKSFNNFKILRI